MSMRRSVPGMANAILIGLLFAGTPSAAFAQEQCYTSYDTCLNAADERSLTCEATCESSANIDACYTRCETRLGSALDRCETRLTECEGNTSAPAARAAASSPAKPSLAQGNGCYLGECPDDPTPPTSPTTPVTQPGPTSPPITQPTQQSSWICQTPVQWCTMNQAGPVGLSCWCNNPYFGYGTGVIIPQG